MKESNVMNVKKVNTHNKIHFYLLNELLAIL